MTYDPNEYRIEQQNKSDALQSTAKAIIAAMGSDWTAVEITDYDTPSIVTRMRALRADGMSLNFYRQWNKPRLEVSPIIPPRRDSYSSALRDWGVVSYNTPTPECTVAMDRDPKAAAKQILRVVVAPYEPMYRDICLQRAKDTANDAQLADSVKTLTDGLAKFGEVRCHDMSSHGARSEFTVIAPGGAYRTVMDGSIYQGIADLKIPNVSIKLALKIAALVEADRATHKGA